MIPGDLSTLRRSAAEALKSVAERGDESAKAALIERLKVDSESTVRWETSCSTPCEEQGKKGTPLLAASSRQGPISATEEEYRKG
eukprot:2982056-Amphidinium_carterae.1